MEAMGIIFSNIYDNNMGELTRERTSASIPFGSRYRQIDFALSNMANSKISNIGIVTKYNYQSLMDHLGTCEEWDLKLGEGVRFLPPYATGHTGAYRGKLEAMQTAMPVLSRSDAEYVVLSDTTVLCAINFAAVLEDLIRPVEYIRISIAEIKSHSAFYDVIHPRRIRVAGVFLLQRGFKICRRHREVI